MARWSSARSLLAIGVAGLLQRIVVLAGFQWLAVIALVELRGPAPARALACA